MLHEIMHIIGICPDAVAHFDLIDAILALSSELNYLKNIFRTWVG